MAKANQFAYGKGRYSFLQAARLKRQRDAINANKSKIARQRDGICLKNESR